MSYLVSARRDFLPTGGQILVAADTKSFVTKAIKAIKATERASVVSWRFARLAAAGFPPDLGERLAVDTTIDLHALLDLVDRGCPPSLAARILAPLDEPIERGDR